MSSPLSEVPRRNDAIPALDSTTAGAGASTPLLPPQRRPLLLRYLPTLIQGLSIPRPQPRNPQAANFLSPGRNPEIPRPQTFYPQAATQKLGGLKWELNRLVGTHKPSCNCHLAKPASRPQTGPFSGNPTKPKKVGHEGTSQNKNVTARGFPLKK